MQNINSKFIFKGETIMTIVVVISVLVLLIAVIIPPLASSRNKQLVRGAADDIVAQLVTARSKTLASYNSTVYGVHFNTADVTVFTGATYAAGLPTNVVQTLNGVTVPSVILNGGGSDVVFDRLTGATNNYGTINVQSSDASIAKIITITKTGLISVN